MIDLSKFDNLDGKRFKTNGGRVVTAVKIFIDHGQLLVEFKAPSGAPLLYTPEGICKAPFLDPAMDLLDGVPL